MEETCKRVKEKVIPIPRLQVRDSGVVEYGFLDFALDLSEFQHVPTRNDLLLQNLENLSDRQKLAVDAIDFTDYNPTKEILALLIEKPEIDYEKCAPLLFKLISEVTTYYENKYDRNLMCNIVMMNKKDIATKIYLQMMREDHFYVENGSSEYAVIGESAWNTPQHYTCKESVNLYDNYRENIKSVLFEGIKKGVFDKAKFDSLPELLLARVLERDEDVRKWLRPAPTEFNITYNRGRSYVPDFVVEVDKEIYLVEVKGEDKLNDEDVITKRKASLKYCEAVTNFARANGKKEWHYPHKRYKETHL